MADEWYAGLDADHMTHITSRGLEKLDAAAAAVELVKGHRSATVAMGGMVKMPADASDPTFQAAYDKIVGLGAPKTPDEYKFDGVKRKDGSDLPEADATFVRDLASKFKLPVHVAVGVAGELAARADTAAASDTSAIEVQKQMNDAALHAAWNTEYDQKAFSATKAAEAVGFTPAVLAAIAATGAQEFVKNMNALVFLGSQMNEATILRGGGMVQDTTVGLSPQQASDRLDALKQDPAWRVKFLDKDQAVMEEFGKLNACMHSELRR